MHLQVEHHYMFDPEPSTWRADMPIPPEQAGKDPDLEGSGDTAEAALGCKFTNNSLWCVYGKDCPNPNHRDPWKERPDW